MAAGLDFDPARVERVLIYRLGSLGDTVVALPALRVVERAFPHARRLMLTNIPVHAKAPAVSAILEGSGIVHGYMDYPVGTRSARELARIWWNIRRYRPQVMVYLTPPRGEAVARRDEKFFRLCGVKHIVGTPVGDLSASRQDPATGLWEREASRLLRCVEPLGSCDLNDLANWDLGLTEAEVARAAAMVAPLAGRPLIACGPGTKMQSKDWGRENWRALLGRMSAEIPDHGLVLVGAADDAPASEYAAAAWRGPVVNLCGKLTPRETAAVVRDAELFLGPDSGPMHLAAAYGVPCAIAFAALDLPGRWFPIGRNNRPLYHKVDCFNCRLTTCIEQQKKCILSISVDEMLAAALDAMQEKRQQCQA